MLHTLTSPPNTTVRSKPIKFKYVPHAVVGLTRRASYCEHLNNFWVKSKCLDKGSFGSAYLFVKSRVAPGFLSEEEMKTNIPDEKAEKAVVKSIHFYESSEDRLDVALESVFATMFFGQPCAYAGELRTQTKDPMYIWMPFVEDATRGDKFSFTSTREFLSICKLIVNTLDKRAHQYGVIHGDIKANNFFIRQKDDGYEIIFIDFTLTRFTTGKYTFSKPNIELNIHIAPEIRRVGRQASVQQDIFSLGQLFFNFASGIKDLPLFSLIEQEFEGLCGEMKHENPEGRPSLGVEEKISNPGSVLGQLNKMEAKVQFFDELLRKQDTLTDQELLPTSEIIMMCKAYLSKNLIHFIKLLKKENRWKIISAFGADYIQSRIPLTSIALLFLLLSDETEEKLLCAQLYTKEAWRALLGDERQALYYAKVLFPKKDRIHFLAFCYERIRGFLMDPFPEEKSIPPQNITAFTHLINTLEWFELFLEKVKPENRMAFLSRLRNEYFQSLGSASIVSSLKLLPSRQRLLFVEQVLPVIEGYANYSESFVVSFLQSLEKSERYFYLLKLNRFIFSRYQAPILRLMPPEHRDLLLEKMTELDCFNLLETDLRFENNFSEAKREDVSDKVLVMEVTRKLIKKCESTDRLESLAVYSAYAHEIEHEIKAWHDTLSPKQAIANLLKQMKNSRLEGSALVNKKIHEAAYFKKAIRRFTLTNLLSLSEYMQAVQSGTIKCETFDMLRTERYFCGSGNTRTWRQLRHHVKSEILNHLQHTEITPTLREQSERVLAQHSGRFYGRWGSTSSLKQFQELLLFKSRNKAENPTLNASQIRELKS